VRYWYKKFENDPNLLEEYQADVAKQNYPIEDLLMDLQKRAKKPENEQLQNFPMNLVQKQKSVKRAEALSE
jgi:hypothetical protein